MFSELLIYSLLFHVQVWIRARSVQRVTEWSRLNVHQHLWLLAKVKVKVRVPSEHAVTDMGPDSGYSCTYA